MSTINALSIAAGFHMLDRGINPIEIFCERAHQRGMKFIAGARFGDDHGAPTQGAQWMFDHPEFILRDVPPGPLANPGNTHRLLVQRGA